jgi:hypothetical protein
VGLVCAAVCATLLYFGGHGVAKVVCDGVRPGGGVLFALGVVLNLGLVFGAVARHMVFPSPEDVRSRWVSPTSWRVVAAGFFALAGVFVVVAVHQAHPGPGAAAAQSAVFGVWGLHAARARAKLRQRSRY